MNWIASAQSRHRLVLAVVGLLALIGMVAWLGMDRQEDPSFPYRYGHLLVSWPGADPERVQRLVLKPLEEELADVEELVEIRGTARLGLAHLIIGMNQNVNDTDAVWEQVRMAVRRAEHRLPEGAGPVTIKDRSMDSHGIVLAISGSDDLLELLEAARQLRRDLFRVPDMGRVELIGDPGEALEIALDQARLKALGLGNQAVIDQIEAANRIIPAGTLAAGQRNLVIQPLTDFDSLESLAELPIALGNGSAMPLSELATLRLRADEPATTRIRSNGQAVIALGIVIPDNRLNAVRFGEQVRAHIDQLRPQYAPLMIEEMFYQPYWVSQRLSELGRSLLLGVIIVALVLLTFMGWRLGLTVAALLPLVTLSGLAVYAMGGGILHQMAVAGLVIALGMLVDNAIVMVENLQYHLDRGKQPANAASAAIRELAGPLAAATGTTLAAFTPLLLARGDTADFTRAIPVMVMLILAVSYFYAILVTPAIARYTLKPRQEVGSGRLVSLGNQLGSVAVRRPLIVLGVTAALIVLAGLASTQLQRDFFPSTDRNELIVDLNFSEGTRVEHTDLAAANLAAQLAELPGVQAVHQFSGFSGPRFYYNLIETPRSPHLARVVAVTSSDRDLPALMDWIREHAVDQMPDAQVVARRLGQGPPVDAPIEIRIFGNRPDELAVASDLVMRELRTTSGAVDIRHRLGDGMPSLIVHIDDAEAARYGITRAQIASTLAQATQGRQATTWRAGREPLPVLLRSPEGDRLPSHALAGLNVDTAQGPLPLERFVRIETGFQPAVIEHRDLQRMTAVLAETREGFTYSSVLDQVWPRLQQLDLPEGISLALGGSAAEADSANQALFQTLPIGVLLLLVFLLWQFNSFRLVGIVLLTVPLAVVGVIPGLLLAGQPFSFTATLGVVALIGIVVNNAIVLIDLIETHRRDGLTVEQAISGAVGRRIRPILLTTATTIAGLLPLTFTQSTLWPPMAWAIISGLLAASALTLLVIPAVYRLTVPASEVGPVGQRLTAPEPQQ